MFSVQCTLSNATHEKAFLSLARKHLSVVLNKTHLVNEETGKQA